MQMRRFLTASLATILALSLAACSTTTKPADPAPAVPAAITPAAQPAPLTPIKVKVGVAGLSINFLHFWLAEKNGFFKEEGLDMETVFFDGGPMDIQALIAGEIQIDVGASSPALAAAVEGGDVMIVSTFVPFGPFQLIARPGIKTAADLKDKKVGISRIGAESHNVAIEAISRLNMSKTDVAFLPVGGQASRLQAMIAGSVDATVVSPPGTSSLVKQGYTILVDLMKEKLETAHENVIVRQKLIDQNPEMIDRFMRGFARGIHYFRTNPEGTKKIMAEYLKLDPVKNKDDIEDAYALYREFQTPIAPYPSLLGIKSQLQTLAGEKKRPEVATMDPAKFADSRFVKKLEDSGFLKKLYGQ